MTIAHHHTASATVAMQRMGSSSADTLGDALLAFFFPEKEEQATSQGEWKGAPTTQSQQCYLTPDGRAVA